MILIVVLAIVFSVLLIRWIFRLMRRLFKTQPKTSMA
jgi:predicted tellurium resistance membrane protein TerC